MKEQEGAKLCGEGKASPGFTGHRLQSRHWAKLEPGGCAIPGREETWPRSSAATSMLCDLGPHSDLSVLSFCRSHIPVEAWGIYKGSSEQGVYSPLQSRRATPKLRLRDRAPWSRQRVPQRWGWAEGWGQESTQRYNTITCSSQMLVNKDLLQ